MLNGSYLQLYGIAIGVIGPLTLVPLDYLCFKVDILQMHIVLPTVAPFPKCLVTLWPTYSCFNKSCNLLKY